jgi:outer membrane protein assembly factor BamB
MPKPWEKNADSALNSVYVSVQNIFVAKDKGTMAYRTSLAAGPWDFSWEYAEFSYIAGEDIYLLNVYGIAGGELYEIRCEPEKGDRHLEDARNRTIAEMGTDSWELVSTVQTQTSPGALAHAHTAQTLYFKRMLVPEE